MAAVPDRLLTYEEYCEFESNAPVRSDRGRKFERYTMLPSLTEYLLIAQDRHRVDLFRRRPNDQWLRTIATGRDAVIAIESLGVTLPLAAIYEGVELNPEAEATESP